MICGDGGCNVAMRRCTGGEGEGGGGSGGVRIVGWDGGKVEVVRWRSIGILGRSLFDFGVDEGPILCRTDCNYW